MSLRRTMLALAAVAVLSSCTSTRGGLPATLQLEGSGLLAAGYDGRTMAIAYNGAGSGAVVESESGLPLWAPIIWDGAGLYVRVRHGLEERFPAELDGGLVRVRVPAELAPFLEVLPLAPWFELVLEEPAP